MTKRALLLTAFLALPLAAAPNLSGTWMLNPAKSQYGQFPAPEVMVRQIQHKDPALSMSTFQKGAQGEVTTQLKYTTDGKPAVNGDNQGTARWDGDKLIVDTSRDYQGAKLTSREEWTLSADGKTLTIATHLKLPNGEFDVKQVFEKAPSPAASVTGPARANF
jgi:hypothetical protein